jgi:hypothetical protein
MVRKMRAFVLSAFAVLGVAGVTAVAEPAAKADVIVRDHRDQPGVRVHVAPPVVRTEVRVRAPSTRHVWVPGYWNWQRGRHVWTGGRWRLPPTRGQIWVEPRWVNEGGDWVFYNGYWGEAPGAPVVVVAAPPPEERWEVEVAPPPRRSEERPPPPERGQVWIRGYWGWDGTQHVWAPGHWEAGRPGWVWAPGRWERHGHHWRWQPGRWRHR